MFSSLTLMLFDNGKTKMVFQLSIHTGRLNHTNGRIEITSRQGAEYSSNGKTKLGFFSTEYTHRSCIRREDGLPPRHINLPTTRQLNLLFEDCVILSHSRMQIASTRQLVEGEEAEAIQPKENTWTWIGYG